MTLYEKVEFVLACLGILALAVLLVRLGRQPRDDHRPNLQFKIVPYQEPKQPSIAAEPDSEAPERVSAHGPQR